MSKNKRTRRMQDEMQVDPEIVQLAKDSAVQRNATWAAILKQYQKLTPAEEYGLQCMGCDKRFRRTFGYRHKTQPLVYCDTCLLKDLPSTGA